MGTSYRLDFSSGSLLAKWWQSMDHLFSFLNIKFLTSCKLRSGITKCRFEIRDGPKGVLLTKLYWPPNGFSFSKSPYEIWCSHSSGVTLLDLLTLRHEDGSSALLWKGSERLLNYTESHSTRQYLQISYEFVWLLIYLFWVYFFIVSVPLKWKYYKCKSFITYSCCQNINPCNPCSIGILKFITTCMWYSLFIRR